MQFFLFLFLFFFLFLFLLFLFLLLLFFYFYFFSAIVGEIAGYAWKPNSAGSSVGVSGLLGAVGALLLVSRAPQARVGAFVILLGAATLAWFRDLHGPPILFGFALALLLHRLAHPPSPRKTMTQIV